MLYDWSVVIKYTHTPTHPHIHKHPHNQTCIHTLSNTYARAIHFLILCSFFCSIYYTPAVTSTRFFSLWKGFSYGAGLVNSDLKKNILPLKHYEKLFKFDYRKGCAGLPASSSLICSFYLPIALLSYPAWLLWISKAETSGSVNKKSICSWTVGHGSQLIIAMSKGQKPIPT